jgi:regulator of sigma E protease
MAYNFSAFKQGIKEAEDWVTKEFTGLRTGRATLALLDGIMVESYGTMMPLSSVANMSVEDARSIRISPWDASQIKEIEKAIIASPLGISPTIDEKGLRVIFPDLTSERRVMLMKVAKEKLEDGKIRIRQEREKTIKDINAKEKDGEYGKDEAERNRGEVDKLVKEANAKLEEVLTRKEKEIQSFILFLLILAVLIFVHELGHFAIAKLAGIRVDEFALGFPPTLIKKKYGETVYKLNIIPFGGYVSIFGENPDDESLHGPDSKRSMSHKNRAVQAAVLVAGVVCNLIFAWLLISLTLAIGISPIASFTTDSQADTSGKVLVVQVLEDSPAAAGGLQQGDIILGARDADQELSGSTLTVESIQNLIAEEDVDPLTFEIMRGTETQEISVTPSKGIIADKPAIGISMDTGELIKAPWYRALYDGLITTFRATVLTATGLWAFLVSAVQGTADFGQVAGPVGIVGMVGNASASGLSYILFFTALISINLAIINILPFPALDGGRLLFVAIEAITRKNIPPNIANTFNAIGFVLLIGLMLVITYHDVAKMFIK